LQIGVGQDPPPHFAARRAIHRQNLLIRGHGIEHAINDKWRRL
jgi:hypothetical protein